MSCFSGLFPTLPGVACDNFAGANRNADQFFLSHCHTDHMRGLEELCGFLRRKNAFKVTRRIYCSMISKTFLVNRFGGMLEERYVRDLFPNEPVEINVFDEASRAMYKVRVTALPANHCPGSIMFLFERLDEGSKCVTQRVLYTGDFRLEGVALSSLRPLHDSDGAGPLRLDEMYVDSTFCHPAYATFPMRRQALDAIWALVNDWVRKNGKYRNQRDKHVVLFHLPAQYGSEMILKDIYEKSNMRWRIHVSNSKFRDYLCSEDLGDCTEADPKLAQWIHACSWKEEKTVSGGPAMAARKIPCQSGNFEVMQIRPSAMYFCQDRIKEACALDGSDGVVVHVKTSSRTLYRVCYSSHSSMSELIDFVKYFNPKKVIPCAVPPGSTLEEVKRVLEDELDPILTQVEESSASWGSLGTFSPEKKNPASTPDPQLKHLLNLSSPPEEESKAKKRKIDILGGNHDDLNEEISHKRALINKCSLPFHHYCSSSDDDGAKESCSTSAMNVSKRRLLFHRSKTSKNYSMPVEPGCAASVAGEQQSRRASLPHNLKIIPAVIITPSSPSPDPNHPDYPEFFEDRLYLETKRSMSTSLSTESGTGSASTEMQQQSQQSQTQSVSEDFEIGPIPQPSVSGMEVDSASLETMTVEDSFSPEVCYESLVTGGGKGEEVVCISSSSCSSVEDGAEDKASEELDDFDSTPEFDVVLATAKTEAERRNCLSFAKKHLREKK